VGDEIVEWRGVLQALMACLARGGPTDSRSDRAGKS